MNDCGRFYFYRNGEELRNHPLNGSVFEGTGPDHRTKAVIYVGRTGKPVTVADFDNIPVTVRLWFPEKAARTSFFLAETAS